MKFVETGKEMVQILSMFAGFVDSDFETEHNGRLEILFKFYLFEVFQPSKQEPERFLALFLK